MSKQMLDEWQTMLTLNKLYTCRVHDCIVKYFFKYQVVYMQNNSKIIYKELTKKTSESETI